MNIKNIKALAQIMESSGLTYLSVSENDVKIRLEKKVEHMVERNAITYNKESSEEHVGKITSNTESDDKSNNTIEVKSPMVGVFFAAAAPEAENYVKIGSHVKKGDILCIIEAMKLMNEITAEVEGEVVEICVQNEQVVEYSQVLFKIK